ncbi:MAG TPA: response regulator [Xanthobacteraceae bacterium]|nr:response regulator [Xanthobacteraceae bacterium]
MNIKPSASRLFEMTLPPNQRFVFAPEDRSVSAKRVDEPIRILIVEDDFLVAMQIETALIEEGFDLIGIATSADEAIEFAQSHCPALIIMDVRLAGQRDGIDAALQIFRDLGIRCIFATAHYDKGTLVRAEPSQPLGWLQKPYEMASLVHMIRSSLKDSEG